MAFKIPNLASAAIPAQAAVDSVDFDILATGPDGTGVLNGCNVTPLAGLTVTVDPGSIVVADLITAIPGGTVTSVAADLALPRFDLVWAKNDGSIGIALGTAATVPAFPAIPSDSVILASLYIAANQVTTDATLIYDRRIFIGYVINQTATPGTQQASSNINISGKAIAGNGFTGDLVGNVLGTLTGSVVGTATGNVPNARTLTTTTPLTIDGGGSADLSVNRTLAIAAATDATNGYLTAADHKYIDFTVIWANKVATGGSGTSGAPYTGWDTAIDWTKSNQVVRFPQLGGGNAPAYYKIANGGMTVTGNRVWLIGDGPQNSIIRFDDASGTGIAITFYAGASEGVQSGIKGFGVTSTDAANKKIFLKLRDQGYFSCSDIGITDGAWTGGSSIGIQTKGREFLWFDRISNHADIPFSIELNDGAVGTTISFDHSHIQASDLAPLSGSSIYAIQVADGVYLTNSTFRQLACVRGAGILSLVDTAALATSMSNIVFDQIRHEQGTVGVTYLIDLESTNKQIQNVTIQNVYGGLNIRGIKLRSVKWGTIINYEYVDTAKVALDIDNTCGQFAFVSGFRQTGSSSTIGSTVQYSAIGTNLVDNAARTGEIAEHRGRTLYRQATAPALSGATGLGAGTATVVGAATDMAGVISLNPGAGSAAAGGLTITFSSVFGQTPSIQLSCDDGTGVWPDTSIVRNNASSASAIVIRWATNGAALTNGSTYRIHYRVTPSGT